MREQLEMAGRGKYTGEIRLTGNWKAGWAIELHTLKSVPADSGHFETTYSETGEALHRLKYHDDRSKIPVLAKIAIDFLEARPFIPVIDVLIPVPPSNEDRPIQPVFEIARLIGEHFNLRVDFDYIQKKRETHPLKDVQGSRKRSEILEGVFSVADDRYKGKNVLLFDDLFRSGATLKEITNVLYQEGKVGAVYVLTLTRTRAKK